MRRAVGVRVLGVVALAASIVSGCSGGGASDETTPGATALATASDSPTSTPATPIATSPGATTAASTTPSARPTPVPSDGQAAGQVRIDPWGIDQVWVPAGSFTMGSTRKAIAALTAQDPPDWVAAEFPSEQPAHDVRLTHGYWLDRTEVTNAAFAAFVDAGGYTDRSLWSAPGLRWLDRHVAQLPLHCQGDVPEAPRLCVTWYEAEAYAAWRAGRLPTEAEWEFAARGPESSIYPYGNGFDIDVANVINSVGPKPVGSFPDGASWVGALDLSGNAMEWVADWLDPDYFTTSPVDDPTGPETGTRKVEKGGWWGSNEFVARAAYRHYEDPPDYNDKHIGFRIVSR